MEHVLGPPLQGITLKHTERFIYYTF